MGVKVSVEKWVEEFDKGFYSSETVLIQISAGWYDWENVSGKELAEKTKKIAEKIKKLVSERGEKFAKEHSMFFRIDETHDYIVFISIETGDITEKMTI